MVCQVVSMLGGRAHIYILAVHLPSTAPRRAVRRWVHPSISWQRAAAGGPFSPTEFLSVHYHLCYNAPQSEDHSCFGGGPFGGMNGSSEREVSGRLLHACARWLSIAYTQAPLMWHMHCCCDEFLKRNTYLQLGQCHAAIGKRTRIPPAPRLRRACRHAACAWVSAHDGRPTAVSDRAKLNMYDGKSI